MTEVDLTRMPSGEMGWWALIEWAKMTDDRAERYFLEMKSDVDLTTKHGRHKVAKFILGAAHRDPVQAAKRFGGHALMMLGVEHGLALGIAPFEAKDLAREVQKFTGADGPVWDFERIAADADRDVIIVVVDPPTGQVWPCLSDGDGLANGDVYIRADGETRKARGDELRTILARPRDTRKLPDITVEIIGEANEILFNRDDVADWITDTTAELQHQLAPAPSGILYSPMTMERRTKAEFRQEVAAWSSKSLEDPALGLSGLAATFLAGIQVRVVNPTVTFLREVRIDIDLPNHIRALDWRDPEDSPKPFPDRPKAWGSDSYALFVPQLAEITPIAWDPDRRVEFESAKPSHLSLTMKVLRPKETFLSSDSEVVLAFFVLTPGSGEPFVGNWQLTAGDVDDVLTGELKVAVAARDWTEPLRALLGRNDA